MVTNFIFVSHHSSFITHHSSHITHRQSSIILHFVDLIAWRAALVQDVLNAEPVQQAGITQKSNHIDIFLVCALLVAFAQDLNIPYFIYLGCFSFLLAWSCCVGT